MQRALPTLLLLSLITLPACQLKLAVGGSATSDCNTKECALVTTPNPYRHVVAFKFQETTTDEQIESIIEDFAALQGKIDTITDFEHGKQVSPEPFSQGYTHVFVVTFKDRAGLDVYLPHPAHKEFVDKLLPLLDPPPFVVDYVAE